MSVVLFIVGFAVTISVFSAFALLVWAEINDGRTASAYEAGENHDLDDDVPGTRAYHASAATWGAARRDPHARARMAALAASDRARGAA